MEHFEVGRNEWVEIHHFKHPEYEMSIKFDRKTRVYRLWKTSRLDNRELYMSKSVFKEWYAQWTASVRAEVSASIERMDEALFKSDQTPD